MSKREIVTYPNQILRKQAVAISKPDKSIKALINEMIQIMEEAHGLGLAANQIGVLYKIIVYNEGSGPKYILNPKITNFEGEQIGPEGCLSFPGLQGEVKRAERVEIKGNDLKGKSIKIKAEGLLARIFQHETDHLNGTLFIDRADPNTLQYITQDQDEPVEDPVGV